MKPHYDRHGVYHIATRGGHEVSLVVVDDGDGWFEGLRCDVRDLNERPSSTVEPRGKNPTLAHNAHVVVADEGVTVEEDGVDLSTYFGSLRSDRIAVVEFPDLSEAHSTRYAQLADSFDDVAAFDEDDLEQARERMREGATQ